MYHRNESIKVIYFCKTDINPYLILSFAIIALTLANLIDGWKKSEKIHNLCLLHNSQGRLGNPHLPYTDL